MNSDTLDLGGERREQARKERCRGHRCGRGVSPTDDMQGKGAALQTASRTGRITYLPPRSRCSARRCGWAPRTSAGSPPGPPRSSPGCRGGAWTPRRTAGAPSGLLWQPGQGNPGESAPRRINTSHLDSQRECSSGAGLS
jgi:hypothetical protein